MYVKPYAREGAPPTAASALGGPWREALWQLFRTFCILGAPWRVVSRNFGRFGRCFFVFVLHLAFYVVFFAFWTSRGPSRTPKNHENHCTVIRKQEPADF